MASSQNENGSIPSSGSQIGIIFVSRAEVSTRYAKASILKNEREREKLATTEWLWGARLEVHAMGIIPLMKIELSLVAS